MIDKALIPIAGSASRLKPLSDVVPKAMLPIPGLNGKIICALHAICTEATRSGIRRIGVIVSPDQREICERYFASAKERGYDDFSECVEYIEQPQPAGFGDAVLRGAEFVNDDPFILLLGDHLPLAKPEFPPCVAQVRKAFCNYDVKAMIGMQIVDERELSRVGVASGEPVDDRTYRCTAFVEKPAPEIARRELTVENLESDRYLAHCGIYAFAPDIMKCLEELSHQPQRGGPRRGELQFADAQSRLLQRYPEKYYLYRIAGSAYDIGTPENYIQTFVELSQT